MAAREATWLNEPVAYTILNIKNILIFQILETSILRCLVWSQRKESVVLWNLDLGGLIHEKAHPCMP